MGFLRYIAWRDVPRDRPAGPNGFESVSDSADGLRESNFESKWSMLCDRAVVFIIRFAKATSRYAYIRGGQKTSGADGAEQTLNFRPKP